MTANDSSKTGLLLRRLSDGDESALDGLLNHHRTYLRRLVDLRMEDELRRRVDPSDVVQEAQLMVSRRIDRFLRDRPATFRIWLRSVALERLIDLRRSHLAAKRSVRREVHLSHESSFALVGLAKDVRASQALRRKEQVEQVREAIFQLKAKDREILLLRHIEGLTNTEVAEVLAIEPDTARKRLGRAIIRLTQVLTDSNIQLDGF